MATPNVIDFEAHIPPQSVEAEMSALGAMLISQQAASEVSAAVSESEFYIPAHCLIFSSCCRLLQSGKPIDFVTLRDDLDSRGKLADAGGVDYLVQIAETVPSALNAASYARIVREKALLRSIIAKARSAIRIAQEHSEKSAADRAHEVAADFAKLLSRTWSHNPVKEMSSIIIDDSAPRGVDAGFPSFNRILSTKGLPLNQITVVQAASNQGKTPLMMQMALNAWRAGHSVCYAIFADLSDAEWKRRLIKQVCGRSGPGDDIFASQEYGAAIAELNDPFSDNPARFLLYDGDSIGDESSIEAFLAWLTAYQPEYRFSLVCHDYIQRMRTTSDRPRGEFERISHIAGQIRSAYKTLSPPAAAVVGSQVTDKGDGRTVAAYGRQLMEDAGFGIEILREKNSNDVRMAIRKNRFGRAGITLEGFEFDEQRLTFVDPMEGR